MDEETLKEFKSRLEKNFDIKKLKDGRTREGEGYKLITEMLESLEEREKINIFLAEMDEDVYDLYQQIHEKTGKELFMIYTT